MRSPEERLRLAREICEAYAVDGEATIPLLCNKVGIGDNTFYSWLSESSELSKAFEHAKTEHGKAKQRFDVERKERERELAHHGAAILLGGGQEETEELFGEPTGETGADGKPILKITRIKKTKRTLRPCATTVKHILEKTDPDYRETVNVNVKTSTGPDFDGMADEEVDRLLSKLESRQDAIAEPPADAPGEDRKGETSVPGKGPESPA